MGHLCVKSEFNSNHPPPWMMHVTISYGLSLFPFCVFFFFPFLDGGTTNLITVSDMFLLTMVLTGLGGWCAPNYAHRTQQTIPGQSAYLLRPV